MPVLINFKICDNSEDCSGIEVCPAGAFYWDSKDRRIAVDETKCITCGKCEDACPVGAIGVAKTEEEKRRIKKEIDSDPRRVSDLFIDRYGAQPVHKAFQIPQRRFEVQILRSTQPAVVELFKDESVMCLLNSIPVSELFKGMDVKYRKIGVERDSILKKYGVKELPALLFFIHGKLVGKIEGYYDLTRKEELLKEIDDILSEVQ